MASYLTIIEAIAAVTNNNGNDLKGLQYKKTDVEKIHNPGEDNDRAKIFYYSILKDGHEVGTAKFYDFFGNWNGTLYGKDFKFDYGGPNIQIAMNKFLGSTTGVKWASNLHKYKKKK